MVGLENPLHLGFLLVILLLAFGAKRLPEMGRSLGSGLRGSSNHSPARLPLSPRRRRSRSQGLRCPSTSSWTR